MMRLGLLLFLFVSCHNTTTNMSYEQIQLESFFSKNSNEDKREFLDCRPPSNSDDSICWIVLHNLLELKENNGSLYKDGLSIETRNRLFVHAQADSSSVFNFVFIEFYNGSNSEEQLTSFATYVCNSSDFFEIKNPYTPVEPIIMDNGEK